MALFVSIFFCAAIWAGFVGPALYNCTDTGPSLVGFIFPGDWTHHPVQVDRVVLDMNMEHSDTIKAGWSVGKIWLLWFGFVGVAFLFSTLFAWLPPHKAQSTVLHLGTIPKHE